MLERQQEFFGIDETNNLWCKINLSVNAVQHVGADLQRCWILACLHRVSSQGKKKCVKMTSQVCQ